MYRPTEWDVEITFDATYYRRPGEYTPYVARAYPRGLRTLAWMLEEAATEAEALLAIRRRIATAEQAEDAPSDFPHTWRVTSGEARLLHPPPRQS